MREKYCIPVPANMLKEKVKDYYDDGATSVTEELQTDGTYIVCPTFPDNNTTNKSLHAAMSLSNNQNDEENSNTVDTLARTLWGEARGESKEGREAIASVIHNRLKKPSRFGKNIEGVCRKPKQFSCWNDGDPNLPKLKKVDKSDPIFAECIAIAEKTVQGHLDDLIKGADHYHALGVSPPWSHGKMPCTTIGETFIL